MKNFYLLFLGILCIHNIKGNDLKTIKNEYWSFSTGTPWASFFTNYCFYEDGTFSYQNGYSGGAYYVDYVFGNYYYNDTDKIIMLEIIKSTISPIQIFEHKTPSKIAILEITDDIVKIVKNDNTIITMNRKIGITSDQYWFKGWHSSGDCFSFSSDGRAEIRLNNIEYFGEYSIIDNFLYFEITSKKNRENYYIPGEIEVFDIIKRIFIRINILEEIVMIEKVDIEEIIDGTRDWEYKDGKYCIKNKIPEKEILWEEYNRRKRK